MPLLRSSCSLWTDCNKYFAPTELRSEIPAPEERNLYSNRVNIAIGVKNGAELRRSGISKKRPASTIGRGVSAPENGKMIFESIFLGAHNDAAPTELMLTMDRLL